MTKTLPVSEVKMKLTALVKGAAACDDEIVITRNGRPAAVILGYSHYESLIATMEVLGDEEAMRAIREFQKAEKEGTVTWIPWEEVEASDPDLRDDAAHEEEEAT